MSPPVGVVPAVSYTSTSGPHLAYQVFGEGPIDIVFVPGFISHIEYAWKEPLMARFLRRLATFSRVITFDKRGMGLSDRDPHDATPDLSERLADLTAVLDAADSSAAVILAWSEGGPMAITFAARHPERTHGLVLLGTTARFTTTDGFAHGVPREILMLFVETLGSEWVPAWPSTCMRRASPMTTGPERGGPPTNASRRLQELSSPH